MSDRSNSFDIVHQVDSHHTKPIDDSAQAVKNFIPEALLSNLFPNLLNRIYTNLRQSNRHKERNIVE